MGRMWDLTLLQLDGNLSIQGTLEMPCRRVGTRSHLMDGLHLSIFPVLDLAQEWVAKTSSSPPSHPPPALGWDPDSYLWRLAGREALWAWGPPGLRAPPPPV